MSIVIGRNLPLSLPRRFVGDVLHFASKIPSATMQRTMHLAPVVAARQAAWPRPGWVAIFLKAYSILAARRPHLRQCWIPFPWPHLYEHPENVASVAITRDIGDEEALLFARLRTPEKLSLLEIERWLRQQKNRPLESSGDFRRILRVTRLPRPIRRLIWRAALHGWGPIQAEFFGTLGISVVASLGASGLHMLTPVTTSLNYEVFEPDGSIVVRLTYDHRVRDGAAVARTLTDLEAVLHGEVLNELRYLEALEPAA